MVDGQDFCRTKMAKEALSFFARENTLGRQVSYPSKRTDTLPFRAFGARRGFSFSAEAGELVQVLQLLCCSFDQVGTFEDAFGLLAHFFHRFTEGCLRRLSW